MPERLKTLLNKAEHALQNDETVVALLQLETAYAIDPLPRVKSKLAYCLAKERRQYKQAKALCLEALQEEPNNPDHYCQLSRIHLLAGQKQQAIKALRRGLKFKKHQLIIDELIRLGVRKEPICSSLPRDHIINRFLGVLLTKLGSR